MKTRLPRLLLIAFLGLLPLEVVRAATTVEVMETFPAGTQLRLPSGQTYYLRLRYEADATTRLWVRPYLRGEPARAGSNPSFSYPAGSGEALGFFFLMNPGDAADEIRIEGGDGSTQGAHTLLRIPVNIVAVPAGATPSRAEPGWVVQMRAAENERRTREMEQAMNDSSGGEGIVVAFMGAMLLLLVGSVAWPIRALRRWRGGWRIAALVPLATIGFVVLRIIVGVASDPTSHNLWPFEIIMTGLASIGAMVVFVVMRWFQKVQDE